MDAYNRHAEYGPVYATRRHRWLTTAVYELPFGRNRQFGANSNRYCRYRAGRLAAKFHFPLAVGSVYDAHVFRRAILPALGRALIAPSTRTASATAT